MLSKKCKYAIHALLYLAERYQKGPVHIQEILSSTYLEGNGCELGKYGYNRDKKKGKTQIVLALRYLVWFDRGA